jgi:hypothetical protein
MFIYTVMIFDKARESSSCQKTIVSTKISLSLIQLCVLTIKYCNISTRFNYLLIDSHTYHHTHTDTHTHTHKKKECGSDVHFYSFILHF